MIYIVDLKWQLANCPSRYKITKDQIDVSKSSSVEFSKYGVEQSRGFVSSKLTTVSILLFFSRNMCCSNMCSS